MTLVRDEAWVLQRFIETTLQWADELVLLDQNSTDGSRDIAAARPHVHLFENQDADSTRAGHAPNS